MSGGVIFDSNYGPVQIDNLPKLQRPGVIGKLIEIISMAEIVDENLNRTSSDIDRKIAFNALKRNKWIAELYKEQSMLVDSSIQTLDKVILNGSAKLKRQLKSFYNQSLGKFGIFDKPIDLELLKLHSDNIVDDVIKSTQNLIDKCSTLEGDFFQEDIDNGIKIIVSYSIIECVVLENPNDYN